MYRSHFVAGIFNWPWERPGGNSCKTCSGSVGFSLSTAAAVRMLTETTYPKPKPIRLKKNCYGPGGVLGKYSRTQAEGQEILMKFNEGNTEEM